MGNTEEITNFRIDLGHIIDGVSETVTDLSENFEKTKLTVTEHEAQVN